MAIDHRYLFINSKKEEEERIFLFSVIGLTVITLP